MIRNRTQKREPVNIMYRSLTSKENACPRSWEASLAPSTRSTVRTLVAKSDCKITNYKRQNDR